MRSDWGQTGESKFRLCPKAGRIGEESVNSSITDAIQMQMTFLPVLLQRFNLIFRPTLLLVLVILCPRLRTFEENESSAVCVPGR